MIQNLIFDLGGVHYALAYGQTQTALTALQQPGSPELPYALLAQAELFNQYERGELTTPDFRARLRSEFGLVATDQQLDQAWNRMLLHLIPTSVPLIQSLSQHYRVALLSNINELHYQAIAEECAPLFAAFERCFFSYQIGLRKPEPAIFAHVLDDLGFDLTQTLFVDDSVHNIAAAQKLGLTTYLVDQTHPVLHLGAMLGIKRT